MRLRVFSIAIVVVMACRESAPSSSAADSARRSAAQTADGSVSLSAVPTDSISEAADRGRVTGNASASLWFIAASDFQCPYCKDWHDATYPYILRDYVQTAKVRMAYLNYPIPSLHRNAYPAAEAAMCASAQGKFWQMHDALFKTQDRWGELESPAAITTVLDSLALSVGVNGPAWRNCTTKHLTRALIDADRDRLTRSGVKSTPTFFIGDGILTGAKPYAEFKAALDQALAKSRAPAKPGR
jgi:protein-disulfide isomerase